MEFFDKLGKKASEAYKITADKTGKIAKETKMKLKINDLKSQVNDIYEEIGKKVYEKHKREEEISIEKDLEEECIKIDVISDEIDNLLKQCLELKDKKQCQNCYKQISIEDKYCSNCGAKQTEEPQNEVEILKNLESSKIEQDNKTEANIIKESLKEKIENDNNQKDKEQIKKESVQKKEQTQKGQASREEKNKEQDHKQENKQLDDNVKKDITKKENNKNEKQKESNLEKTVEVESDIRIKKNNNN